MNDPVRDIGRGAALLPPALLLGLSLFILCFGLGSYGIVNVDEAYYHALARRMVATGDWFTLEFDGEVRAYDTFTHAPLFLWAKALWIALLGDGAGALRGVSAGCAVLTVLATYGLGTRLAGRMAGFAAALSLLLSFQFVYLHSGRTGEMEPPVALFCLLSAWTLLRALEDGKSFVLHHLCLVALFNLKLGLAVIPPLAVLPILWLQPEWRPRLRQWLLEGAAIVTLGLSWHAVQAYHMWEPFVATLRAMFQQAGGSDLGVPSIGPLGNLGYYAATLYVGAFPQVLLYPVATAAMLRGAPRERAPWVVIAGYAAAIALYYTLVSLHFMWYVVPLYPLLSLFVGGWLVRFARAAPDRATLAYLALASAFALWTRISITGLNPFARSAAEIHPEWSWATLGPVSPSLGIPVTALMVAALFFAARSGRLGSGLLRAALAALLVAAVGLAALRVVAPLRYRHTASQVELLHRNLERRHAAGEPIDYPVALPRASPPLLVLYFFGDDYRLRIGPVNPLRGRAPAFTILGRRE